MVNLKALLHRLLAEGIRIEKRIAAEQARLEINRWIEYLIRHAKTGVDPGVGPGKNGSVVFLVDAVRLEPPRRFVDEHGQRVWLPEIAHCVPAGPDGPSAKSRFCPRCGRLMLVIGVHSDKKNFATGDHYDELNLYGLCYQCLQAENFARACRPSATGLFIGNRARDADRGSS